MASWRKAQRLVALCEQRKHRVQTEIARIERARQSSLESEAQLEAQMAAVADLLAEQHARSGVMSKARLFEVRRHLAVLLSQRNDLRQERAEAVLQTEALQQQAEQQRQNLLLEEKKRNKYQTWIAVQRRLSQLHQGLVEQSEIEERTVW